MATNSKCTYSLLHTDCAKENFSYKFPMIFKIQIGLPEGGFTYATPFDIAIAHNQMRAIGYLIDYVVEYQNNFTSSTLF